MKSRGKGFLFKFSDKEKRELKNFFKQLDLDGGGSIGAEELETPLISLGIAKNRKEVEEIVYENDEDGEIFFEEFLEMLLSDESSGKKSKQDALQDS